jgi:hypothetical protein
VAKYKRSRGQKQQRRRYGAAKREEVLADVPRLGVGGAADKHGVPTSCVSRWWSAVRQEGKTGAAAEWARESWRRRGIRAGAGGAQTGGSETVVKPIEKAAPSGEGVHAL